MKTFVFTDIVQSVDLKGQMLGRSDAERDQAFVASILAPHRERIEAGLVESGGRVVSTAGDGHFLVFENPIRAAAWAVEVQQRHDSDPVKTPKNQAIAVRMSLHVGFPQADPSDPNNFIGKVVDYTARLNDYATGGQILISTAALGLLRDAGLDGVEFHAHGRRPLRGIGPIEIHELLYGGSRPRDLRGDPAPEKKRQWTVLPATMGLTEFNRQASGAASQPASDVKLASEGISNIATSPGGGVALRKLGNYELGELLGAGGMGNVYKARHSQFERLRAVKVIKPHFVESGHQEVIRRFYREIKAIGALDHPNIVVAIDSSAPDDQTHYLVMEYVDGVSADDVVSRHGPLEVPDACEIIRQAAIGLEYIHRQRMVHRDIKPSNLMLACVNSHSLSDPTAAEVDPEHQKAVVKILDLGLALLVSEDQPRLTRMDHGAMGTAMYMSPEQWNTTSVDIRSDIYSLGCTLYHLLTGKPPYYDSDYKPQKAHEKAPPPSLLGPEVPAGSRVTQAPQAKELDAVLQKMMAKSPADRYQTPAELAEALAPLAADSQLLELVNRYRRGSSNATTQGAAHTDTLAGHQMPSDTFGPLPPVPRQSWELVQSAPPTPSWRRHLGSFVAVASILAAIGLAWFAIQLREEIVNKRAELIAKDEKAIKNAVALAAPQLSSEIKQGFSLLDRSAGEKELQAAMRVVNENPDDVSLWQPVQEWINAKKPEADANDLPSESWFITNRLGRQIARSPKTDSTGKTYWDRDYFHGLGKNLDKKAVTEVPPPLDGPNLSAVYLSTSTGKLKVAFSVPIYNGEIKEDKRQVIGVLGMSVELGEFKLFEDALDLSEPLEVVLIDLRQGEADIGDTSVPQRGMILHHPGLKRTTRPVRLSDAQLETITATLTDGKSIGMLRSYPDFLGRNDKQYWGAFRTISVPSESQNNANWLVLVEEPSPE